MIDLDLILSKYWWILLLIYFVVVFSTKKRNYIFGASGIATPLAFLFLGGFLNEELPNSWFWALVAWVIMTTIFSIIGFLLLNEDMEVKMSGDIE